MRGRRRAARSRLPADGSQDFAAPVRPARGELEIPADVVYLLTGYRADAELLRRAGVTLNERDAPVHDPVTFETNVPGLFVAGGAIAGVDTAPSSSRTAAFTARRSST